MNRASPLRIVLAKVGLDGHDRGIKVVARGLRDAGLQVIYAGRWQSAEAVVRAAADEDADWLGLSMLSGAHMTQVPPVLQQLREQGLGQIGVIVGGIIPAEDEPKLRELGVARVFGPGTPIPEIVAFLRLGLGRNADTLVREPKTFTSSRDLARLITLVSRGEQVEEIRQAVEQRHATGRSVAFTGSAGVGKSTLVGKLLEWLRQRGERVAVLACDPESPVTGGALLGDRVRMHPPVDDGLFLRSLAVPSGQQSVAEHLSLLARLAQAFGFGIVLLETAGAGQGDTAVRNVADVVVVLVQPESGDELQWEKAGLLEVADVVVVQKSDLPGAERIETQLRGLLNLPGCREVPVVRVSAHKNQGLEQLWAAIEGVRS